jgi:predicted TIM-barrel fold metal-dependent hydrolase
MKCRCFFAQLVVAVVLAGCEQGNQESNISGGDQVRTPDRAPIIDMHMHARSGLSRDAAGQPLRVPCMLQPCITPPPLYAGDESILQRTLAAMERYNIVLGFMSDRWENVDHWTQAAPDRFLPSAGGFGPPLPDIEELRRAYQTGRFKGMGEIGTQYRTIAPNDPQLVPYFALAEKMDVPVLIHTAGLGARGPGFRSHLGRPLLLEEVVVRHPRLRIYFENAGYPFLDEALALMTQYPQVYADVSTITWIIPRTAFHRYLRNLMEAGLGKQLMFGSDQMEWPEAIGLGIEAIEAADFLTAEQKRDIFYNNASRFLRLHEKPYSSK